MPDLGTIKGSKVAVTRIIAINLHTFHWRVALSLAGFWEGKGCTPRFRASLVAHGVTNVWALLALTPPTPGVVGGDVLGAGSACCGQRCLRARVDLVAEFSWTKASISIGWLLTVKEESR